MVSYGIDPLAAILAVPGAITVLRELLRGLSRPEDVPPGGPGDAEAALRRLAEIESKLLAFADASLVPLGYKTIHDITNQLSSIMADAFAETRSEVGSFVRACGRGQDRIFLAQLRIL